MTDWISCCVPFCRRRTCLTTSEWICHEHWPLVDRRLKAYWRRQMRKRHREWEVAEACYQARDAAIVAEADPRGIHIEDPIWAFMEKREKARHRWWVSHTTIWGRIKRQAITRAAGGL